MKKYTFKDFIEKNIAIAFNNREEVMAFLDESIKRKLVSSSYISKYHNSFVFSAMKNKRYGYFIAEQLVIGLTPLSPIAWELINYKDFTFDDSAKEIHITVKGNQTHATLKENGKVIKHEVAKCHPDDEFDFETGAKLAFDRLFDKERVIEDCEEEHEEDDKLLNCSFEVLSDNSRYLTEVLSDNSRYLTAGKVYDVVNGVFVADNKECYPGLAAPLTSFEELECYLDPNKKYDGYSFDEATIKIKPINKVQRLAKPGEYVMIVNPILSKGYYGKHDIGVAVGGEKFVINGTVCTILQGEYVILDGYEPIKKTKKVLAVKSSDDYLDLKSNMLGTRVLMRDVKGNPLNIGDIVKVFDCNNELHETSIIVIHKDGTICPSNSASHWWINGIATNGDWIVLDKKYTEVNLGDELHTDTASSYKVVEIEVEDND